jgi:hypothetical protein
MCKGNCKHWLVSTEIIDGNVIQTCKDCKNQVIMPGIMSNVMEWMKARPEYATKVHYIEKVYSRTI